MSSTASSPQLADKDKLNYIAALSHYTCVTFSLISVYELFKYNEGGLAGVSLALLIIDRLSQFIVIGVKTYKWSRSLLSLVYLDYLAEACDKTEGRGQRLFFKKYIHVLMISSPFALLSMLGYFRLSEGGGLLFVCSLMCILDSAQTNLEYYCQNIFTIAFKQRFYVFIFIFCEHFYRNIFVSYFQITAGEGGIIGYFCGVFIVCLFSEMILSKKENLDKSYYIGSMIIKGWTSVFYFRMEDIMVQDADEWREETKNNNNFRQQSRLDNIFKSRRSKLFIGWRFLENMFLTIVGISQFSESNDKIALFVIAVLLIPCFLLWNIKYCRYNYSNKSELPMNDSAIMNKYQDRNSLKESNLAPSSIKIESPEQKKVQKIENQQNQPVSTPFKNKYTIDNSEQTYSGSEKKNLNLQESQEKKSFNSRRKINANFNNNNNINDNHSNFNEEIQQENGSLKKSSAPNRMIDDEEDMQQHEANAFAIE